MYKNINFNTSYEEIGFTNMKRNLFQGYDFSFLAQDHISAEQIEEAKIIFIQKINMINTAKKEQGQKKQLINKIALANDMFKENGEPKTDLIAVPSLDIFEVNDCLDYYFPLSDNSNNATVGKIDDLLKIAIDTLVLSKDTNDWELLAQTEEETALQGIEQVLLTYYPENVFIKENKNDVELDNELFLQLKKKIIKERHLESLKYIVQNHSYGQYTKSFVEILANILQRNEYKPGLTTELLHIMQNEDNYSLLNLPVTNKLTLTDKDDPINAGVEILHLISNCNITLEDKKNMAFEALLLAYNDLPSVLKAIDFNTDKLEPKMLELTNALRGYVEEKNAARSSSHRMSI